jgi:hypothetical protein
MLHVDVGKMVAIMKKRAVNLLFMLFTAATARGAEPVSILPSDTDPRISEFNSPHLAWLPEGRARNQLLLFLPGTGGTPEKGLFHPFAATAAGLGYHVVALMYPDNLAAQKKCSPSDDPDAYLKFRNAIIRGGVIGPRRRISPRDSIEGQLEPRARQRQRLHPRAADEGPKANRTSRSRHRRRGQSEA